MVRMYLVAMLCCACLCTPALAQEREWQLDVADQDVFLVFGVPNTGDVGISLWCNLGSGTIQMFSPVPVNKAKTDAQMPITLTINDKQQQRAAKIVTENGRSSFEFTLSPEDTLLDQLTDADHFSFSVAGHTTTFPMTGADVPAFRKLCKLGQGQPSN